MRSVLHVLGPARGGMRRHVRRLAEFPPPGYRTLGVMGPADLATYFQGIPFTALTPRSALRAGGEADLIHAHGFTAGLLALRPRGRLPSGRPPLVLTVHVTASEHGRTKGSRALRLMSTVVAHRSDAVIGVSRRIAARYRGGRYVPPVVEPLPRPARSRDQIRAELGTAPDKVVLLALARLHPDKRLDLLVEAVRPTSAEAWIAGEGPEAARLGSLAAGAPVRLLGPRTDPADLLEAADALTLPSRSEGYPIAVVEAIAAKRPVIATRVGEVEEIAGEAGLFVGTEPRLFIDAVRRFIADADLRATLSDRAQAAVTPSAQELTRGVGAVYEEALR